jgi:D-serine dehydratase
MNLIILCVFMLVVINNTMEPSVEDPSHVGESFLSALKARDSQQLAKCFHSDIHVGFLTPNRSGEVSGSIKVAGGIRLMLGNTETFTIEESNVKRLSDNKILISYRFRLDAETYYEQRIFAIVKDGLIEAFNLLCSGSFNPGIKNKS